MSTRTALSSLWRLAGYSALAGAISLIRGRRHNANSSSPRRGDGVLHTGLPPTPAPATPPSSVPLRKDKAMVDKRWWAPLKEAAVQWSEHKDARSGAALAYYSVFSIGPLIVIAIAVAGLIFDAQAVQGEVTSALRGLLGDSGAKAIEGMLASASKPSEGILATIIGVGTLIFAAVGVVVQLKDALNTVWEVETPPGKGIWRFMRTYVVSLAGVLAIGFLLLLSMLLTAGLAAASKFIAPYLPELVMQVVGFVFSFAVISLLFAMMFKWLPDTQVHWRDVWLGAVLTAGLFEIGKFLIGLYIGKQGLESTYGAAASIVIVLIWVYYSAQLVLMGAEFTNVQAKRHGNAPPRQEATA
jgi:membrane protein